MLQSWDNVANNVHELFTVSSHTQRKLFPPTVLIIYSTVCMQQHELEEACMGGGRTLNLLRRRPHPLMQVNSSCSKSPLQCQHSRSAWTSKPPDYDKEQTSSLASLEALWPTEQASQNMRCFALFVRECISMATLYHHMRDFRWIKCYFAKPSYLGIAEKFGGKSFHQRGKGCHILYAILNKRSKI